MTYETIMDLINDLKQPCEIHFYTSMYDYVESASIEHYRHGSDDMPAGHKFVFDFIPSDDSDFGIINSTEDGWLEVNWGEEKGEHHFIPEKCRYEECYGVYEKFAENEDYEAHSQIYDTKEEAEKVIKTKENGE